MSGFLHGVAGITLYMVGICAAFAAAVAIWQVDLGGVAIFGGVAYACWLGIVKLTSNPYA